MALAMEDMEAPRTSWGVEVPSQPLAVDWDDDGFTDLILAPEGRFFRRKPGVEKDGLKVGLVFQCLWGCAHQLIGPIALTCFNYYAETMLIYASLALLPSRRFDL